MEFFVPRYGAPFDENNVPLGQGGTSGGFSGTRHDNPRGLHDRRRQAFFPPLVRGIFNGLMKH